MQLCCISVRNVHELTRSEVLHLVCNEGHHPLASGTEKSDVTDVRWTGLEQIAVKGLSLPTGDGHPSQILRRDGDGCFFLGANFFSLPEKQVAWHVAWRPPLLPLLGASIPMPWPQKKAADDAQICINDDRYW